MADWFDAGDRMINLDEASSAVRPSGSDDLVTVFFGGTSVQVQGDAAKKLWKMLENRAAHRDSPPFMGPQSRR